MTEASERVAAPCPKCSPSVETIHEVLATGGGMLTLRCTDCGHVHKEEPPADEPVTRDVIVSQDGESFAATVEAPPDETVRVGEEFVLDTADAIMAVRITDLEVGPERRVREARVEDVETFWTRAVDNVRVDVTVHPGDGGADGTHSVDVGRPGDHEFVVGELEELDGRTVTVEGIVIRADASGYPARKLDRPGDAAPAKDVQRVYAREEGGDAWSAW